MFDTQYYKQKPKNAGLISNRIINNENNPITLSPKQLATELTKGMSFIPGILSPKLDPETSEYKIKRKISYWHSQQIICLDFDSGLTIEQAIQEFKHSAMFIYTTFSHSEKLHKFRVVFLLNERLYNYDLYSHIMDNLLKKYPYVDSSCKDGSRIFYGGSDLYVLDYNNKLDIYQYIDSSVLDTIPDEPNFDINHIDINHININNTSTSIDLPPSNSFNTPSYNSLFNILSHLDNEKSKSQYLNVKYIINKDIQSIKYNLAINDHISVEINNYDQLYDYIYRIDLRQFLGIKNKLFKCIFHHDNDPSANIIQFKEDDHYFYKCFGNKCKFKTGTIIKCIEELTGYNRLDAVKFIKEIYNIDFIETDWQKRQKEILEENQRYIMSDEFPLEYPELYNAVKNYLQELYILHGLAKDYVMPEKYGGENSVLIYLSVRYLAEAYNISRSVTSRRQNLLTYLGLIEKLMHSKVNPNLIEKSLKHTRPGNAIITYYNIPLYSKDILDFGNDKAIEFEERGMVISKLSKKLLIDVLGEEEAKRVFPKLKYKIWDKEE